GLRVTPLTRRFSPLTPRHLAPGHSRRWYNESSVVLRATRSICVQETPGEPVWFGTASEEASRGWRVAAIRRISMYPEEFVQPMRHELTSIGFQELRTPAEVDALLTKTTGTVLVVVNSICGCAAGRARPAVAMALENKARPEVLATVFAGQDTDATTQARSYFTGYPPSSPSVALLRDGKLVFMLERKDIEGRDPYAIAEDLTKAFDRFCSQASVAQAQ